MENRRLINDLALNSALKDYNHKKHQINISRINQQKQFGLDERIKMVLNNWQKYDELAI